MKIWVGVTDKDWFEYLSRLDPDEVNFWQPSGSRAFKVLTAGEPFLFKLHSPNNYNVGGGFFIRYSALPASLAWDAFERKNGVASFGDLRARIQRYRRSDTAIDPTIGCNVLAEPFFVPRDKWISAPADWSSNIVQGKTYELESTEGRRLWDFVHRMSKPTPEARDAASLGSDQDEARFGAEYLTRGRLGQGAFRVLVTDAYQRRCAVTGERTLPVLEAAHIVPHSLDGPNRVVNGMLLRSDLHKLFDLGYVTITPDFRVRVSERLRTEFQNGHRYYPFHDRPLVSVPAAAGLRPSRDALEWHEHNKFLAA